MNGLHCDTNLAQDSKFIPCEAEFSVLKVGHFHPKITDKIVVKKCCSWSGEMRRNETPERSPLATKHKLLVFIGIGIAQSWVYT